MTQTQSARQAEVTYVLALMGWFLTFVLKIGVIAATAVGILSLFGVV